MKTLILFATGLFLLGIGITSCQKENDLLAESQAYEKSFEQENDEISPWGIDPSPWSVDPLSNYPDPFKETTTIRFMVTERSRVTLVVYNKNSRQLTYLRNAVMNPGIYEQIFDASGKPAGVYFARLRIGDEISTEKMIKVEHTDHEEGSSQ